MPSRWRSEPGSTDRAADPVPGRPGHCYLIEDEPLTLIDTGPNSGKSLDDLDARSPPRRRIEDLELIVVTHQHIDHLGLLEILARRSGPRSPRCDLLGPYLADWSQSAAADDEFAQVVMRRHGVPDDLATVLGSLAAAFRAFGSSGHVTRELRDGDELEFRDRTLEVYHRPGHSPSDTIFWDPGVGMLIAATTCSRASRPIRSSPGRCRGRRSTPAAGARPVHRLDAPHPRAPGPAGPLGHGDPILEHVGLIDERLRMHRRRANRILHILDAQPLTAHEIALRMWETWRSRRPT